MFSVYYFARIILMCLIAEAANFYDYQETADTLKEITNPEKYSKFLRPYHQGNPVNVTVGMTVVHFGGVREMEEEFSLDLVIRQSWTDPRLNHSLSYPIILLGASKELIWLPDTFFLNVRSATLHDVISENSKVSIRPGGHVIYSTRLTISAGCAMDLSDYPMDEQKCDLEISTYAYTTKHLHFKWLEGSKADKISVKDEHLSQMTLMHTDALKGFEYYTDGITHSKLIGRFWFKRRLGYAFLQIYFPTMMLVVLSWLVFWIPQHSVPARVALGSTTVLSIVTWTGSFRNAMPKVSYIKAVDIYFVVSFAFIFAALMEYILLLLDTGVKRQRYKSDGEKNGMEDMDKGKGNEYNGAEVELKEIKVEKPVSRKDKPKKMFLQSVKTAKEYMHYAFIKNEASYIDRVCRYLFPCCYVVFNFIYWCYYEMASFGKHPPGE